MTMIAAKLQQVHARIEAACAAAGRPSGSARLLAVSKTFGAPEVRAAAAAGQRAFGENYVQEGVEKITALQDLSLQWHMIGPVQGNKTRLVASHFDWVHSIDRLKTAERLAAQRPAQRPPLQVCIQVNIDGGANKSGVAPDAAAALAQAVADLPGLCLRGLMVVPEPAPDFEAQKSVFMLARALFGDISRQLGPAAADFDTLSMGMSADLEAAIHAGSTLVRVGSAIFGQRG
ncbi:MAG TPA: YggS family pyridoxal phosphate-dependent enzyme [Burkholderiaceae bacterium]